MEISPPPLMTVERAIEMYKEPFRRVMDYITQCHVPGQILEFGTYRGFTAYMLAQAMKECKNSANLFLYDSWMGFPSITGGDLECPEVKLGFWSSGDLNLLDEHYHLRLEKALNQHLGDGRVKTIRGYYNATVFDLPKAALVHVDCDLYESTMTVLTALLGQKCLVQGTVIMFDEFNNNYASWKYGERAAVKSLFPRFENGTHCNDKLGLEPWFTYGSSGYAFIVQEIA